jgi:hypothetical protein
MQLLILFLILFKKHKHLQRAALFLAAPLLGDDCKFKTKFLVKNINEVVQNTFESNMAQYATGISFFIQYLIGNRPPFHIFLVKALPPPLHVSATRHSTRNLMRKTN